MEQHNKPLVSIAVPIYRTERYLGICIESLIHQTYRNMEIILVDDGSDDRCGDICDLYSEKDSRIRVIHKPNGGLVSSRKAGVAAAGGAYIGFVDSDDWVEPDFVARMVQDALTCGADVVCAGFSRDLFDKSKAMLNAHATGVFSGSELDDLKKTMLSFGAFFRPGISTYVWNKLFKRDVLVHNQLQVEESITIGEDAAVTYPALLQSRCVCVNDCVSYHYRQREDSMMKTIMTFDDERKNLRLLYAYLTAFAEKAHNPFDLQRQINEFVLSICFMRSGGKLPGKTGVSAFDNVYYDKRVVVYSAGTFGQQLVSRFKECGHCTIVKWIDDDYWEYRRCCMNVDAVESIAACTFDYVLIATVDPTAAQHIRQRLQRLQVEDGKILMLRCPEDSREALLQKYLENTVS